MQLEVADQALDICSGGSANGVDDGLAGLRNLIAAPGDMLIRPHQHEALFVKPRQVEFVQVQNLQRHTHRIGRALQ